MSINIAIDGPAGAGKSTIAKAAASRLGFIYVDTGAMYRALALYFLENNILPEDEMMVTLALPMVHVTIVYEDGVQQVLLNNKNVTDRLREELVGKTASKVSAYQAVREKLLGLQRDLAKASDVIMDGRDIGTNILPNAPLKIYLTASAQTRAERRCKELEEKGEKVNFKSILKDIMKRDHDDMHREIAPLKQAEDAVYLDTSDMTIEEVIDTIISLYEQRKEQE